MRFAQLIFLHIVPFVVIPLSIIWLVAPWADNLPGWVWVSALFLIGVNLVFLNFLLRQQMSNVVTQSNDVTQGELLNAISDASIGYIVLNNSAQVLFASKSANLLMGFTHKADIKGLIWYDIDYDSDIMKDARKQAWKNYIKDRSPWTGIVRWVSQKGEKSYYYFSICALSDERIIIVIIDRSDRIKAARALQEKEQQHNFILNNMPISITLHDTNQKIVYANKYLADRLNMTVEGIIGKSPREVLPKATVNTVNEMYKSVLNTNTPIEERTVSVTEGALAGTDWLMYVYPLFVENTLEQLLIIGLDRTERARLAREKEQFARKLFETQKIEAINKFAGGLAHELSNLLHPAGVYARALKEDPDLQGRDLYLARINSAVIKSGEIVRRTLSMSRSSNDDPMPVNLNMFLSDFVEYAEDIAPHNLAYDLIVPSHQIEALTNETELRQVLLNLLINAAHAQQNQGTILITLGVDGAPPANTETAPVGSGPFAWIDVTDSGTGIDGEVRQHIFEPFFTTKGAGEGTGLGLSVVQGIVTGWGGLVSVDTAPGKGSTFRVWIPVAFGANHQDPPGGRNGQNTGN